MHGSLNNQVNDVTKVTFETIADAEGFVGKFQITFLIFLFYYFQIIFSFY